MNNTDGYSFHINNENHPIIHGIIITTLQGMPHVTGNTNILFIKILIATESKKDKDITKISFELICYVIYCS